MYNGYRQCCGLGIFFKPGTQGSKRFRIPDPDPHQRILFLTPKIVSKLSEI
jgi:hypothetical protein